jgi:transposase
MGRQQARSLAAYRDWLLERMMVVPDVTLRELVAELRERGVLTSYGSVWRLLQDEKISFKKNTVRHRAGPARRSAQAAALESTSSKA